MRIAKRTDYGVRALLYLAEHSGEGPVQSADIASHQEIPEAYLEQLLGTLRKAGIIRSTRGPQGGHVLAVAPDQVTLADVLLALEGPPSPMDCVGDIEECQRAASCALREVWRDVGRASQQVLESTTIGELARRQRGRTSAAMYHI
ncbi:MAG: Rrf2 family transcriptional regulator [Chloroflexi bacterium]|nr:Rrf2 family transcriptional regulator [Chloroflexota bacterium]